MPRTSHQAIALIAFLVICFGAAALGGAATYPRIENWYAALTKPCWTPPDWIFGPVWTALYTCMAVAAWHNLRHPTRTECGMVLVVLRVSEPRPRRDRHRSARGSNRGNAGGVLASIFGCRGIAGALPGVGRLRKRVERCDLAVERVNDGVP